MNTTYQTLATNSVLTSGGTLATFEDLADNPSRREQICVYRHGNMTATDVSEALFDLETPTATTITTKLKTGEDFTLLAGSKLLLSDGTWVTAEDLKPGSALKTFTYNRRQQHPQFSLKIVDDVITEWSDFSPSVQYEASCSRFLLALERNTDSNILIPTKGVEVKALAFA